MNKSLITLLIIIGTLNSIKCSNINAVDIGDDIVLFLKGFLVGSIQQDLNELNKCDFKHMGMITTYKEALEKFKGKKLDTIIDGLKLMAKFVGESLVDLGLCPGVRDSVMHLSARLMELTNPINFVRIAGKNVVIHSFQIIDNVNQGVQAEKDHDHFEFGRRIGLAIALLIN
ncbi:UNKNOWN [Stylonychia lemnae]|uniref:Secreted protein n=1 Tax=Stylonychia lemnae TaxID=5949 RepID=A0A078AFV3_STYLE|nr:UNKNOWN [Stylonychia lemnae]|eukprot:CDW81155.1 UNKNOWN [Stylonychia lemnae]